MNRKRIAKIAGVSAFVGLLAAPFAGCLDPEPLPFSFEGKAMITAECLTCLNTPDTPGPGCGDEIAACKAVATCNRSLDCSLARQCIGGSVQVLVACLPECTNAAGFTGPDDPGRNTGFAVYTCITQGACAKVCFTDSPDAGMPRPDATSGDATPPDVQDGAVGDACLDAADQTVLSDAAKVQSVAQNCGIRCYGNADKQCNAKCMISDGGLTPACAACWGGSIDCVATNCLGQCLAGGDDPDCRSCTAQNCTPAFHACSGT
jgi:hypothetical protein